MIRAIRNIDQGISYDDLFLIQEIITKQNLVKGIAYRKINLSGKEDRYWANDQIEKGFNIFYDPKQEVKHHYTPEGITWTGTG